MFNSVFSAANLPASNRLSTLTGWSVLGTQGAITLVGNETGIGGLSSDGDGGGTGRTAYICTESGADGYVEAVTGAGDKASATGCVLACRIVDKDNYVGVVTWENGATAWDVRSVKAVAGVQTDLAALGVHASGAVYRIEFAGDEYKWYYDGVLIDTRTILNSEIPIATTNMGLISPTGDLYNHQYFSEFEASATGAAAPTHPFTSVTIS